MVMNRYIKHCTSHWCFLHFQFNPIFWFDGCSNVRFHSVSSVHLQQKPVSVIYNNILYSVIYIDK